MVRRGRDNGGRIGLVGLVGLPAGGTVATPAAPPTVTTEPADGIGQSAATLNGSADPNGAAAGYHFDWGSTSGYGQLAPVPDAALGSDTVQHAVSHS